MRIHILMCRFCARYERQLRLIRETARHLAASGKKPGAQTGEALSDEARERIGRSLRTP